MWNKHHWQVWQITILGIGLLLLLAGCGTTATDGTPAPEAQTTKVDLAPAPPYRQPSEIITTANANRLDYLGRLDVPPGEVSSVFKYAFSPDSTRLAGLNQTLLLVWDLIKGQVVFTTGRRDAEEVYFSADKTEIYTLTAEGLVTVYNEAGDLVTDFEGHPDFNKTVDYAPNDGLLALGGDDGDVKVWDVAQRTSLATIEAHNAPLERVAFSADATLLVTVGYEFKVRVWDWRTRTLKAEFDLEGQPSLMLSFAPNGQELAVVTPTGIYILQPQTGQRLRVLPLPQTGIDTVLAYTPDSKYLVGAGSSTSLTLWDTAAGDIIGQAPETSSGGRVSVAFSPAGDLMATSVLDLRAALWNLTSISTTGIQSTALAVPTRRIVEVGWSPDGYVIVFIDTIGSIYIWGIPAS